MSIIELYDCTIIHSDECINYKKCSECDYAIKNEKINISSISFDVALKIEKEIIVETNMLSFLYKRAYGEKRKIKILDLISNKVPLHMERINNLIHDLCDDIEYIEIMSKFKFYAVW